MKRILCTGIVLGLFFTALQAHSAPKKLSTFEITETISATEYVLDNGLTVVLTENPAAPAVSIYHWVKAGSLHERPGITGIAHLFEHMMFRPLRAGQPSFKDKMKALAGQHNASTRFESTVYTTTVPPAHLKEALHLEAERFKNLEVTDSLLDIEREAVRSEYSTKFDVNPIVDLWFNIYHYAFPDHPYGWMIIGFRGDLDKISAKDANQFFQSYYRPNNTGLFISGDINSQEVLKWVESEYGSWKKGENSKLPKAFASKNKKKIEKDGGLSSASPIALIGHRVPDFNKDNHQVMSIANHILYGSTMSLAKQKLLYGKPLVSEVSNFNFDYDNGLLKAVVLPLDSKDLPKIVDTIHSLPNDFEKLSKEEYQSYLTEYRTELLEGLQRNSSLNSYLSMTWGKYDSLSFIPELQRSEVEVSKKAVLNFLKKYINPANSVVVKTLPEAK